MTYPVASVRWRPFRGFHSAGSIQRLPLRRFRSAGSAPQVPFRGFRSVAFIRRLPFRGFHPVASAPWLSSSRYMITCHHDGSKGCFVQTAAKTSAGTLWQVDGRNETPGTLLWGFRSRWTAGKDTWNTFAGIPCQVEGRK